MMALIALTIVLVGATVLLAQFLWLRHRNAQMEHQERITALERGAAVPPSLAGRPWSPRVYLLRGLIWTFSGAALTLALLGAAATAHKHYRESAEMMAIKARSVSERLEIPIDEARRIVAKDEAEREQEDTGVPVTLSLFGMIPLAVGLAYLVFYYNDPARNEPILDATFTPSPPRAPSA